MFLVCFLEMFFSFFFLFGNPSFTYAFVSTFRSPPLHHTYQHTDVGRFRELLVHEAELRAARAMEQDLPRKLQEAVLSKLNTENELRQTKQQRHLAVQEARRYQQLLDDRANMASQQNGMKRDMAALVAQNDTLVSLVAKYKGKAEQLNVLNQNSALKVRNYEHQLHEVQERNTTVSKENLHFQDKLVSKDRQRSES